MGFIELNLYRFLLLTNLGLRLIPILKKRTILAFLNATISLGPIAKLIIKKKGL